MNNLNSTETNLLISFFDEAEDMFVLFDKNLNILELNKSVEKIFHLKRSFLIGKNILEMTPHIKENKQYDLYKNVIKTGNPILIEDSSLGNLRLRTKAFKVGDGLGMVITNTTDLMETIDELNTFVNKSSHDMRSPIASMRGLIEVAKENIKDIDSALYYFDLIKKLVNRLDIIMNSLIETSQIRQGEKTIELIDFDELLESILTSISFIDGFNQLEIQKKVTIKHKFYSDKVLLTSIFQNLIENAIKYRKKDKQKAIIRIRISGENQKVRIEIKDNGIGMSEKVMKNIFKMFFRASDKTNGSGLGLYIVKNCIKKLSGNIKVESKEKFGSKFIISIPNDANKKVGINKKGIGTTQFLRKHI